MFPALALSGHKSEFLPFEIGSRLFALMDNNTKKLNYKSLV